MTPETERFSKVRSRTLALTKPFKTEDFVVQSMEDASPAKWHLAHTTWFFETFVAKRFDPEYRSPDDAYAVLFNSYYNGVGEQFPRHLRGTLSRPGVEEIIDWRQKVDASIERLRTRQDTEIDRLISIGVHHEEQHQELLITDIKHALVRNPVFSGFELTDATNAPQKEVAWVSVDGGECEIGRGG